MNFTILQEFRHGYYAALGRQRDALFELSDALMTETTAQSLPELSLSPLFTRQWSSIYKGLQRGGVDHSELRCLFAHFAPLPSVGQRMLLGVDASNIVRQYSSTSPDRTCLQVHNLPAGQSATTYGWQFSTLVVLPEEAGSATYILDQSRIQSQQTACEVAASQLAGLAPLLAEAALLEADRYYGSARFVKATAKIKLDKLLRIKSDRLFYRKPPAPSGKRGAPAKDGPVFKCKDPATHGQADEVWQGVDESCGEVRVERWCQLHFKQVREIELQVLRVTRFKARDKRRDPRVSWFIYVGTHPLALHEVVGLYRRRYYQEHGYRFDKHSLLWQAPHLRKPQTFELWSHVLAAVHNQVVLALPLLENEPSCYYEWQSNKNKRKLTPGQARRGLRRIISKLGTPCRLVKVRGKSGGRLFGTHLEPAKRYTVIRKSKKRKKVA